MGLETETTHKMSASAVYPDHDWQIRKGVLACNRYMLENQIACDVTFIVGPTAESKEAKFTAHRYVLMSRSPVFFAMLAGDFAKVDGPVSIPDVQPIAFKQLLRYIYTEDCEMTADNCLAILYAAKKYIIPPLEDKCTGFLKTALNCDNLCLILDQSLIFSEENLIAECTRRLSFEGPEVLESESFLKSSKDCVLHMVKSQELKAEEKDVFCACVRWSEAECDRLGIERTGPNKRRVLGEVLFNIRFPSMDQKYFADKVARCGILDDREVVEVLLYYTNQDTSRLPFSTDRRVKPRIAQCFLYDESVMYLCSQARYDGQEHGMKIMCSKEASLTAVGMYVNKGGANYEYTVSIEHDISGDTLYYKHGYTHMKPNKEEIAIIRLDHPVHLARDMWYRVIITLQGPECGMFGIALLNRVDMEGFQVEFERLHGDDNGDSSQDQVPYLEFVYK